MLRSKGIDTLILFGISTSGQVLSAVRTAVDLDYKIYVVADCCADKDPEVQRILLERILPMPSTVVTSDALIAAIRR